MWFFFLEICCLFLNNTSNLLCSRFCSILKYSRIFSYIVIHIKNAKSFKESHDNTILIRLASKTIYFISHFLRNCIKKILQRRYYKLFVLVLRARSLGIWEHCGSKIFCDVIAYGMHSLPCSNVLLLWGWRKRLLLFYHSKINIYLENSSKCCLTNIVMIININKFGSMLSSQ